MRARTLFLILAVLPNLAAAQGWSPDPNAQRLAWGTANVVLRADTVAGLQVWAATSRALDRNLPRREFAARFDPETVLSWLAYAQLVLDPKSDPREPTARLRTPALLATDQSQLFLEREQDRGRWKSQVRIIFTAPDGNAPWAIAALPRETKSFLRALFETSGRSSYTPHSTSLYEPNPADSITCPQPLSQPVLEYPATRARAGQGGDVWLTFVVKSDSTVDRASIRVLVTDGVEFTAAAVRAVTSVRYRPATSQGQVRDALAFQRVAFLLSD